MPEIPTIGVGRIWSESPPLSIPKSPPVTVDIGVPIINLPSFDSIDYSPNRLQSPKLVLPSSPPAETQQTTPPPAAELPKVPVDEDPRCPPLRAKEVGTIVQGGVKRISGYELQDGKCVVLYETIPLPDRVIAAVPTLPQVTTVGLTAAAGITAGLATPFLLKLIKPALKQAVKKVQKLLKVKPKTLSVFERRKAQRQARK